MQAFSNPLGLNMQNRISPNKIFIMLIFCYKPQGSKKTCKRIQFLVKFTNTYKKTLYY